MSKATSIFATEIFLGNTFTLQ